MARATCIKLVIADDHEMVRESLVFVLKAHFETSQILQYKDYSELLASAKEWKSANLLIVDFFMPGMNDVTGIQMLRLKAPRVPIVVLSGNVTKDLAKACLEAGAVGYVPKTLNTQKLVEGLSQILRGGAFVPYDEILEAAAEVRAKQFSMPATEKPTRVGGVNVRRKFGMTPREYEVLFLISQGFSNKEIAQKLGIEVSTTSRHVTQVMRALEAKNRTDAFRKAQNLGLLAKP